MLNKLLNILYFLFSYFRVSKANVNKPIKVLKLPHLENNYELSDYRMYRGIEV